jgi:hypothetical protein
VPPRPAPAINMPNLLRGFFIGSSYRKGIT